MTVPLVVEIHAFWVTVVALGRLIPRRAVEGRPVPVFTFEVPSVVPWKLKVELTAVPAQTAKPVGMLGKRISL
jgi:hypothetical protein